MPQTVLGELEIRPPPWSHPIAFLAIVYFVVLFSVLAIDNVSRYDTVSFLPVVASAVWLVLLLAVSVSALREKSARHYLIVALGLFSRSHCVQARVESSGEVTIGFGYRLLGLRMQYLKLEVQDILRVEYGPGQYSHKAGRDLGDWTVVIWYRKSKDDIPTDDLYIATPHGTRVQTEATCLALRELIDRAEKENGVVGRRPRTRR